MGSLPRSNDDNLRYALHAYHITSHINKINIVIHVGPRTTKTVLEM